MSSQFVPKIEWEKWKDPFMNLDDNNEEENLDGEDYDELMKNKEFKETIANQQRHKIGNGHVMITPLGLVPITDYNIPSKHYDFWLGHCNFPISRRFEAFLNIVPGVRTLDVIDRYVFRISIGKLFNSVEVKKFIQDAVLRQKPVEEKNKSCENYLKEHLSKKYQYWAILKLEDGNSDVLGGDNKDKVEEKILHYDNKVKSVIKSWE